MSFECGDYVEVLDDLISGRVISVSDKQVSIMTEDGFPMEFSTDELVKIDNHKTIDVSYEAVQSALKEKEFYSNKKHQKFRPKNQNQAVMEVDLHIHELVDSTKNMSNFDMLNVQLDTAKRQLEFAMRKRLQKIVFIHGVGEGVLRTELETLFRRYDNLKFYDADYRKYGLGATEVYIFQH